MAAKLPTTLTKENLGSVNLYIANFDGTVSSNDIDDDDTWASGIKGIVAMWWAGTSDNGYDVSFTSWDADGLITFDSAGTTTGRVFVIAKNM
jgi:hypothetical protein